MTKRVGVMMLMAVLMTACSTHQGRYYQPLEARTKVSTTLFLEPVTQDKKSVYVQVNNISGSQDLGLQEALIASLRSKGYRLVDAPDQAHYWLQATVLQIGEVEGEAAENALESGFGSVVKRSSLEDQTLKKPVVSLIVDAQISERQGLSNHVKPKPRSRAKSSDTQEVLSTQTVHWRRYQTRLLSSIDTSATRATPKLVSGITRAITGVF